LVNALAVCTEFGISLKGIRCIIFENLSTTTIIIVLPLDGGRPHRKSIEIDFLGLSGT